MTKSREERGERASFTLALQGGPDRKGEVALDRLAQLAAHLQLELVRLARAHVDRDRPGRTPDDLVDMTRLSLAGIDGGSTELLIRGAARATELAMEGVPEDLGSVVMRDFLEGIEAVNQNRALPDVFVGPATQSLEELLKSLDDVPVVVIKDIAGLPEAPKTVEFRPRETRELLLARAEPAETTERSLSLQGTLFAVNLHTGQYQIEDDSGMNSRCDIETMSAEMMAPLLGKRVRARGTGRWDRKGRFLRLDVETIELAEHDQMTIDGWPRSFSTAELLASAQPADSLESFAITDLKPGEADALREALRSL